MIRQTVSYKNRPVVQGIGRDIHPGQDPKPPAQPSATITRPYMNRDSVPDVVENEALSPLAMIPLRVNGPAVPSETEVGLMLVMACPAAGWGMEVYECTDLSKTRGPRYSVIK